MRHHGRKTCKNTQHQEFATRDKTDAGEGIETEVLLYHITLKGIYEVVMTVKLILIAGPYRSGTDGKQELIDANLDRLEKAALAVYQRGHIPVIGEWLALPLAKAAGSESINDEIGESMIYPVAHRLITKCSAIYRIEGASKGADMDIDVARQNGLDIYTRLEDIPLA